jgi:hypothetical protein
MHKSITASTRLTGVLLRARLCKLSDFARLDARLCVDSLEPRARAPACGALLPVLAHVAPHTARAAPLLGAILVSLQKVALACVHAPPRRAVRQRGRVRLAQQVEAARVRRRRRLCNELAVVVARLRGGVAERAYDLLELWGSFDTRTYKLWPVLCARVPARHDRVPRAAAQQQVAAEAGAAPRLAVAARVVALRQTRGDDCIAILCRGVVAALRVGMCQEFSIWTALFALDAGSFFATFSCTL